MKTKAGLSHFFKQNEPKWASILGNISFLIATLSGAIMGLPDALLAEGIVFQLPVFLVVVLKWLTIIGIGIKFLTKFLGVIDSLGQPINTTLPSSVGIVDTINK